MLLVLVLALSIFNHHLCWLLSRISAHLENILLLFKKIPSASSRPIRFGQFVTHYFLGGRMCDIQCTIEQTVTATMSKHITETLCRCKLAFVNSNRSGNKTQLTRTIKCPNPDQQGYWDPMISSLGGLFGVFPDQTVLPTLAAAGGLHFIASKPVSALATLIYHALLCCNTDLRAIHLYC